MTLKEQRRMSELYDERTRERDEARAIARRLRAVMERMGRGKPYDSTVLDEFEALPWAKESA